MTNKKRTLSSTEKALNLWGVILIVWAFYRNYFRMPVWFDELIAKPIVFVLPVFYYVVNIDKQKICDYFCLKFSLKEVIRDFFYSLIVGGLFFLTSILAFYFRTGKLAFFGNLPDLKTFFVIVVLALATGITEEILSRGFVLKKLYDQSKNPLSATFFASILFFFLHVPILFTNQKITGNLLLMFMTTDMLLSMVNGLIFLQRKSLLTPIFIHAFYNIMVSLLLI